MRLGVLSPLLLAAIILAIFPLRGDADPAIPDWRLQVRAYGPEQSSVVAIHHRISGRSEIGLQLAGTISDTNSDEGQAYDRSAEISSTTVSLRPEFRRWILRDDRLSTFWGWNLLIGYFSTDTESKDDNSTYESHRESEGLRLGTGVTVGADLELLNHLSVAMMVNALSLQHTWTDWDSRSGSAGSMQTTKRRDRELNVQVNLTPALYVCIRF